MKHRLSTALALAAAAAVMLVPGGQAAPREQSVSTEEYVPFVTDFPKPAEQEPYVPFVTDFPGPATSSGPAGMPVAPDTRSPAPSASELDWGSVGFAGGAGAALAALLTAAWVVLRRRERPAPC